MINPSLDISRLSNDFSTGEIILIKDFFLPDFAETAHQYLYELPEENWYVTAYPAAEELKKHKNLLNTKANEPFINHLRRLALAQSKRGNFAFRFKRTWHEHDMPPEGVERELKLFFESEVMLSVVRKITGKDILQTSSSFSSCYERGDFLSRHNDGNNGLVGFVCYFTQNWEQHWGGNIEFTDRETLAPHVSFLPGFNQLLLFSIKDLAHLQHEVKIVSEHVSGKRMAFSCWFK